MKGSLQINHGTYYVVINYKDEYGKPKQKWISTELKANNNKTLAKQKMRDILKSYDLENSIQSKSKTNEDVFFVDFLNSFIPLKKDQIEPVTYLAYQRQALTIEKYFKNMRIKLKELKPFHIEGFYKSLYERNLSSNSVVHYHVLIRECLQYAFINDLVNVNVADKIKRPKKVDYKAQFYSIEELEQLFEVIKDSEIRIPIMLSAMYGLRRSEVLGLKWDAIDFERKLLYVRHKILETKIDGKRVIFKSDKLKNKTSNRTLPLLPQAEQLLIEWKAKIEQNKEQLCKCYNKQNLEYICVDNLGRLLLPNRITHGFHKLLKKNNLRMIRFHDLRHSCASLMLANGVPMKQIQEWLGHADFGTTANIYSHLDYSSKINSANTISNVFNFVEKKENANELEKIFEENKEEKISNQKEIDKEIDELEKLLEKKRQEREHRRKKQEESEM